MLYYFYVHMNAYRQTVAQTLQSLVETWSLQIHLPSSSVPEATSRYTTCIRRYMYIFGLVHKHMCAPVLYALLSGYSLIIPVVLPGNSLP